MEYARGWIEQVDQETGKVTHAYKILTHAEWIIQYPDACMEMEAATHTRSGDRRPPLSVIMIGGKVVSVKDGQQ
jgi:hypothetical protein